MLSTKHETHFCEDVVTKLKQPSHLSFLRLPVVLPYTHSLLSLSFTHTHTHCVSNQPFHYSQPNYPATNIRILHFRPLFKKTHTHTHTYFSSNQQTNQTSQPFQVQGQTPLSLSLSLSPYTPPPPPPYITYPARAFALNQSPFIITVNFLAHSHTYSNSGNVAAQHPADARQWWG